MTTTKSVATGRSGTFLSLPGIAIVLPVVVMFVFLQVDQAAGRSPRATGVQTQVVAAASASPLPIASAPAPSQPATEQPTATIEPSDTLAGRIVQPGDAVSAIGWVTSVNGGLFICNRAGGVFAATAGSAGCWGVPISRADPTTVPSWWSTDGTGAPVTIHGTWDGQRISVTEVDPVSHDEFGIRPPRPLPCSAPPDGWQPGSPPNETIRGLSDEITANPDLYSAMGREEVPTASGDTASVFWVGTVGDVATVSDHLKAIFANNLCVIHDEYSRSSLKALESRLDGLMDEERWVAQVDPAGYDDVHLRLLVLDAHAADLLLPDLPELRIDPLVQKATSAGPPSPSPSASPPSRPPLEPAVVATKPVPRIDTSRMAPNWHSTKGPLRLDVWAVDHPYAAGQWIPVHIRITNTWVWARTLPCDYLTLSLDISALFENGQTWSGQAAAFKVHVLADSHWFSGSAVRRGLRDANRCDGTALSIELPGRTSWDFDAAILPRYLFGLQPLPAGNVTVHVGVESRRHRLQRKITLGVKVPLALRGADTFPYPSPGQVIDATLETPGFLEWLETREPPSDWVTIEVNQWNRPLNLAIFGWTVPSPPPGVAEIGLYAYSAQGGDGTVEGSAFVDPYTGYSYGFWSRCPGGRVPQYVAFGPSGCQ